VPDEATERRIRVERLRKQIEELVAPRNKAEEDAREEGPTSESPREFVNRKMREWDNER
jgi:hypothetical protein